MTHVCFAALPLGTIEHQLIHIRNLEAFGLETCILDLGTWAESAEKLDLQQQLLETRIVRVPDPQKLQEHFDETASIAVFFQSPYLEHYPSFVWITKSEYVPPFVYLGYGINLSNWIEGHVNLPSFQHFKIIGEPIAHIHRLLARKLPDRALLCGDAMMQVLAKRTAVEKNTRQRGIRLLWAPHWSQTWLRSTEAGYSRFLECLEPMADLLESEPQLEITFRPHPMLRSALLEHDSAHSSVQREVTSTRAGLERAPWRAKFEKLSKHERFRWSESDLVEDVHYSDLLFSEGVSVLAYWAVTGKPFIVWRDSKSPDFNQTGMKILQLSSKAGSATDLKKLVSDFCRKTMTTRPSPLRAYRARRNFKFVQPNPTIFAMRKLGILGKRLG